MTTFPCPSCGSAVKATSKFCGKCGHCLPPPLVPARRRRRRWVTIGLIGLVVILATTCCILAALSARKALQSRVSDPVSQSSVVESGPANAVQPVVPEAPLATALPVAGLPAPAGPVTGYDVFTSDDGQSHPSGQISYTNWDCIGCVGGFDAKVEILGLDVEGSNLVLKLKLDVSRAWGQPGLFQVLAQNAPAPDVQLVINDELVLEAISTTLPGTITEQGIIIGNLVFNGQIPVSESGEYKITLQIRGRDFQPLEGWLKSK